VASVSYGFDPERSTVWLAVLGPAGPAAGALCRRHADAMVLPRGWWLQDRRSDAALFTAPEPAPPAALYRAKRRRRPPADPSPLPLDDPRDAVEGPEVAPSWAPDFDAADDLDGLLAATTPLLSRAFRAETRSAGTMPPAADPSPRAGDA
jgi:hypothetical protein